MFYYALIQGCGEGCDYTIGCGQVFKKLKAQDTYDAKKECLELFDYYGANQGGEERIKSIVLLKAIEEIAVDLSPVVEAYKKELQAEEEEREKALLEKLLRKHGNPTTS